MNLDDETLLSAYLDDELDPADRLAMEWSIETDPRLAEQLRRLVQVRDAVSSLSRPEIPRDLAADFGARLAANRRQQRRRTLARPAQLVVLFSSFTAIAASLIFALILLNHSLHESDPVGPIAVLPDSETHSPRSERDAIVLPVQRQNLAVNPKPVAPPPGLIASKPAPVQVPALDDSRERDARQAIVGMLEQPHVRRIRIVTDVVDASDKVRNLIHQDGRMNPVFGRISVCQEIVIDPDCNEAVEVFAVPMNERDRRAFVGQLARSFPDLVEESEETRPELVTQLTEVGQVALFRGTEAAPLVEPPHDLRPFIANRAEIPEIHIVEGDRRPREPGRPKDLVVDRKVEASKAPVASGPLPPKPPVNPPAEIKPSDRVTVLVWLVARPPRRL